jgi:hypothetical protein
VITCFTRPIGSEKASCEYQFSAIHGNLIHIRYISFKALAGYSKVLGREVLMCNVSVGFIDDFWCAWRDLMIMRALLCCTYGVKVFFFFFFFVSRWMKDSAR